MRKLIFCVLLTICATVSSAQTNTACPGATGPTPHCVVLSWAAPTTGPTPTGYNVYTGGTTAGQCATVTASTCTKVGSVTGGVLTLTQNSTPTTLAEGKSYFYVITSTNGTDESVPSTEVSVAIPFLMPNPPVNPTAVGK